MGGRTKRCRKSLQRARVVVDIIGKLIYINHRLDCPRKMNKFLLSVSAALVASVTVFAAHAQGVQGDIKAGEKKNAMCIGCHGIVGYQASFPEIHKVPKISGQGGKYIASDKVNALLTKGACASCHGDSFSKPIDPTYPKIAGQHSDYLFVALKAYKVEGNAQVGRGNAIMGGVAKQFTNAELKELSNYLGKLPTDLKVVPQNRFR
jgi:cytochrome c553